MHIMKFGEIISEIFSMKPSDKQTVEDFLNILICLENKKMIITIDEILSHGITTVVDKLIENKEILLKVLEFLSMVLYYGINNKY